MHHLNHENKKSNSQGLELQRADHASLVETQNGEWYMTHLCGRPVPSRGRCTMGRETAIQKIKWTDHARLRLESGGNEPHVEVTAPGLPLHGWEAETVRDDFKAGGGDAHFTGSFLGICCQDLSGKRKAAEFDYFEYSERKKTEIAKRHETLFRRPDQDQ